MHVVIQKWKTLDGWAKGISIILWGSNCILNVGKILEIGQKLTILGPWKLILKWRQKQR
jgi:hypothetical protein